MPAQQHEGHRRSVVAAVKRKILRRAAQQVGGTLHAAGGILQPDDAGHAGQAQRRVVRQIRHRAPRHVVQNQRQVDRFGDSFVVLVQAFLRRLVVVRHHRQPGLGARCLRAFGQLDRFGGRVRAGSRNHRHPPGGLFDRGADQQAMLVVADRGRFAGGADDDDAVRPLCDVPVDQAAQRVEIERAVVRHGGDDRNQASSGRIYFCHVVSAALVVADDMTINPAF